MTSSDPTKNPMPEPVQGSAGPGNAGDPSMEDILASIRRILSEDEPAAPALPTEHRGASDDVLLLDASMMMPERAPEPNPVQASRMQAGPEAAPPSRPDALLAPAEPVPPVLHGEASGGEPLLSGLVAPAAAAAAASSVGALVRTIVAERSMQVYSGGPTLEDIVRAELRPQLKQWLDENLPPMVERLVRAELERVIGRAIP
jgi:cell pole-organizing protein PopZ